MSWHTDLRFARRTMPICHQCRREINEEDYTRMLVPVQHGRRRYLDALIHCRDCRPI